MAAEVVVVAAIAALVKEVVGRLYSAATQEFDLLWGFKKDIRNLIEDFTSIQAALDDGQRRKHVKGNNEADLWLLRLRSACLKVENVLDEISTEALLLRLYRKRGIKYMVKSFMSFDHNRLMFRIRLSHKINDIRTELDARQSRRSKIGLRSNPGDVGVIDVGVASEMPNRETCSLLHDSLLIVGRNEETEMVVEKICNKEVGKYENGEIRVYGIWGLGGVGKTTLGRLVYNHDKVEQYFELRCWIYVSQNFQVKEIIRKIIESLDKCECTLTSLEVLQESVQNKLRGRKFLILLDNVWIEDDEKTKWDQLSGTLSCGAEESIVVMTTTSQRTSHMLSKVPELQHNLGCLSKEDSWTLFEKFAFAQGREGDDKSELEPIGREIVKKCERLPLAIKTLGGLMWSKGRRQDWENVKGSIIWNLQEYDVLPALKLSYDNLQPHLQKCFAYCCLFPKGYKMEKNTVIQLWVVNGFIPPREQIDLYVLGEEIFNCLVWRSFFQVVTEFDRYKMHDLMHDMAGHVMRHDCLVIDPALLSSKGKEIKIPNEVLHLSLSCSDFLFSSKDLRKLRSLRSILKWGETNKSSMNQILNHKYVRVLYLPRLRTLPKSICALKHLRYLNLSFSEIEVLPESIIYLQNLQVIILCHSYKLCKLPDGLRYMTNLQYLDIEYCNSIKHLPLGIRELISLRIKLSEFPVGRESGAKMGELGDLTLLEEKLTISRLENVEGLSDAESANLKCKRNLSDLEFGWSAMSPYAEEVLEGLEPNPSLKKLTISHYSGNIISSSWMVKLSNLVEITFQNCSKCECISSLGRIPNLRVINLKGMNSLKWFANDDTKMLGDTINIFPSLEELHIYSCGDLVSLPCNLPKLKILKIFGSDKIVSLQGNMFPSLEELRIGSCGNLVSLPRNLPKLKVLHIARCRKLVSLRENMFPSLEELGIHSCGNFVSLPCNLPKLKVLHINGCKELASLQENMFSSLEHLDIDSCGNSVSLPNLPKLKVLRIVGCNELRISLSGCFVSLLYNLPKFKVLHIGSKELVSLQENMLPSLEELRISLCGNLDILPFNLQKLKVLEISSCEELLSLEENMFPYLEELRVSLCVKLDTLPFSLQKLKVLHISSCKELVSLQENTFPSLEELRIVSCANLVSLPCNLRELKLLHISHCKELLSLQKNMFPSLKDLRVISCANLVGLPCNLPRLKTLHIFGCKELVTLQENMLLSLEELRIDSCGNLVSLSCNLPKLKILRIIGCDGLVSVPDEIQRDLDVHYIHDCKHLNSRHDIKKDVN